MSNLYFDRRATYSLSAFHNHELQDIMTIFLLKPALYAEHHLQKDKQGYFFSRFRRFADDYYHFDSEKELDTCIYFSSMLKECAGEMNACGGAGKISNSAKKEFKSRHHDMETGRVKWIDYFQEKYRAGLATSKDAPTDERLFLGVTEIWNKLDHAAEIIAASKWANIASKSYDDLDVQTPIPSELEKHLIPHSIRNRVWQKMLNSKRTKVNLFRRTAVPDDFVLEEEDTDSSCNEPKVNPPQKMFVAPVEAFDDDW